MDLQVIWIHLSKRTTTK